MIARLYCRKLSRETTREKKSRISSSEKRGRTNNKKFVVDLLIGGKVEGQGSGRTKKAAEQEAAYHTIIKWKGKTDEACT